MPVRQRRSRYCKGRTDKTKSPEAPRKGFRETDFLVRHDDPVPVLDSAHPVDSDPESRYVQSLEHLTRTRDSG